MGSQPQFRPTCQQGPSAQKSLDSVWPPAPIKKQDVMMCAQNPSPGETEKGFKPSDASFLFIFYF